MKKHKFKKGDLAYSVLNHKVCAIEIDYHIELNPSIKVVYFGKHAVPIDNIYPTPEACAQALVDEFYINNPKT